MQQDNTTEILLLASLCEITRRVSRSVMRNTAQDFSESLGDLLVSDSDIMFIVQRDKGLTPLPSEVQNAE